MTNQNKNSPLKELMLSSAEIEKMKQKGELVEWKDNGVKPNFDDMLDKHLIHDSNHRWYWDYGCCGLAKKIKYYVRANFIAKESLREKIVKLEEGHIGEYDPYQSALLDLIKELKL